MQCIFLGCFSLMIICLPLSIPHVAKAFPSFHMQYWRTNLPDSDVVLAASRLSRGWGEFGRLGHGGTDSKYAPEPLLQDVLVGIVQVACGAHHTVAVREDGGLAVWGWGSEGQLGLGSTRDVLTPTAMYDLSAMGHQVSCICPMPPSS